MATASAPTEAGTSNKKRRASNPAIVVLDSSDEEDEATSPIKAHSRSSDRDGPLSAGASDGRHPCPPTPLHGLRLQAEPGSCQSYTVVRP